MVREWIPAIFDRTYGDVVEVQSNPELEHAKGCWNAEDLNRIEKNTAYCVEYMIEKQIYRSDPGLEIKENDNWTGDMVPTYNEIRRVINNVMQITEYARENNANITEALPVIYPSTHIDYVLANSIERALDILHNQPDPPKDYFKLTIEEGIILRVTRYTGEVEEVNANEVLLAEDEVAVIRGVPSEPDAQYKHFQYWSGNEDDLQYLGNWEKQETTYLGQYRNVKFKANFQTRIPRTLKITDGFVSPTGDYTVTSGPTSGTYFAGDRIMIIANKPPDSKKFYEWEGTKEAIKNIVGVTNSNDPSTSWLQMPDCDVELSAHFIYAMAHQVIVENGTGSGWYEYKDRVSVSATVPSHHGFDNWSGDTKYLTDIHQSYQSFEMPDIAGVIRLKAEYSYRPSYNDVSVINGTIDGKESITGAREGSSHPLAWNTPPEGKGFQKWSIEGLGSASDTSFTVGDSNAILTAIYNNLHTCTIVNSVTSEVTTYSYVTGRVYDLSHPSISGYNFSGFSSSDVTISHSSWPDRYYFTMPDKDVTITINYSKIIYHTLTLENINNAGNTTTSTVSHGSGYRWHTNMFVGDYVFDHWEINGSNVGTDEYYPSGTYSRHYIYSDTTVKAVYRLKVNRNLTITNGYIVSNHETSGTYLEGTAVQISKDATPEGASFTGWSQTGAYSIGSGDTPTVVIGRSNCTVTANFSNIRKITVVTHSGTNTYNVIQGRYINIDAYPPPATWEWDTSIGWTIDEGGTGSFDNPKRSDTRFYAGTTDATIRAHYKEIPSFTVTVENGYVIDTDGNHVSSGTFLRDTTPTIVQDNAQEAFTFLQWEVLEGREDNVQYPLAGTTKIINLQNNVRVRATFYQPNPELKFTTTIIRTDGTTREYQNPVGYRQEISASRPAEGMKFYRWEGDFQYLVNGRYASDNIVNTPAKDITLEEHFVPLDWTPTYHLHMTTMSECMYETRHTDPETGDIEIQETWDTEHEYEEGTRVQIRTKNIYYEWKFVRWEAVDEDGNQCPEYIAQIENENTTVEMPDKDLWITPITVDKTKYKMTIIDGQKTDQDYVEGASAEIYFEKITEESKRGEVKYKFKRWVTGPSSEIGVQDLKLYETGKQFNVLVAGTEAEPQFISMPAKNVVIQATYDTYYNLNLVSGTIDDLQEDEEPFYLEGTKVNITANPPEGDKKFIRWEGDTDCVQNQFDPTTTVTIPAHGIKLTAKYALTTDQNDIAISLNYLVGSDTINKNDVTLISGKFETGCIITDSKGHNYVVTNIDEATDTLTITRMTKIYKGGVLYE